MQYYYWDHCKICKRNWDLQLFVLFRCGFCLQWNIFCLIGLVCGLAWIHIFTPKSLKRLISEAFQPFQWLISDIYTVYIKRNLMEWMYVCFLARIPYQINSYLDSDNIELWFPPTSANHNTIVYCKIFSIWKTIWFYKECLYKHLRNAAFNSNIYFPHVPLLI